MKYKKYAKQGKRQVRKMTLPQIIDEVKRMAVDGHAPGAYRFCRDTGLTEWAVKRTKDRTFPGGKALWKLGTKQQTLEAAIAYCDRNSGFEDVRAVCAKALKDLPKRQMREPEPTGFIYLFRVGIAYKVGMTTKVENRMNALKQQLPHKGRLLHLIGTDDPFGIEQYWHKRFAARRTHGEWFRLDEQDVLAFKRRQFM